MAQHPTWTNDKGRVFPVPRFSSILKVWAMQSAKQLQDAFMMQKLWNETRENSVWIGRGTHKFYKTNVNKPVKSRGKRGGYIPGYYKLGWKLEKTVTDYSWYDEVQRRKELQSRYPKRDYWFSTGYANEVSDVKVINATLEDAEIDFHTTAGALFAEAGVGLNGRNAVRGARSSKKRKRIKVDRKAPWHYNKRYVGNWEPSQGRTHRPGPKQQVSLLKRRLKWAAQAIYCRDLAIYLGRTMEESWKRIGKITIWTGAADGSFEIKPVNGNS